MNQFFGKTVVISGGAEGIGFGIAQAMGKQGMNVVLADIDANQLKIAQEKLQKEGVEVLSVQMDVTNLSQWENVANKTLERFGKVHMLVNNAGVGSNPAASYPARPLVSAMSCLWRPTEFLPPPIQRPKLACLKS
jgi:NAD(P)-dependent dehydrogenase (short-subunit alcohol dehydrogenase family)